MAAKDSGSGGNSVGSVGASIARTVKKVAKPSARRSSTSSSSASRRKTSTSSSSRSSSSSSSRRISPSRSSSSSNNRSSSSGRGGGGGTASAPRVPDINSYLGTDSIYQGAVSGGKRSLADFISELGRRKGEANTQFTQTRGSMERDRTMKLEDLKNEFASRGLIQSGLYGEEQGRFQQQFSEQMTALQQQQAALLADLMGQQTNYSRENDLAMQAAKQEALQRRAAKYRIG